MKKSNVNLDQLLEQVSEEKIASAIVNTKAAWGGDDDHEDQEECACEEKREDNNGLHIGICKHDK